MGYRVRHVLGSQATLQPQGPDRRAAAEAFGESGYHAVSMDDIATRVGISAAALYRHASGKYQLFRDAVLALGTQLQDCTDFVGDAPDTVAPVELRDQILNALIDTALANRSSGGCTGARPAIFSATTTAC